MGLGSAFAFVAVLAIAHYWFSVAFLHCWLDLLSCWLHLALGLGECPLKRYLLEQHDWRYGMQLLAVIGVTLGVLAIILVRHKRPESTNIRYQSNNLSKPSLRTHKLSGSLYAFCVVTHYYVCRAMGIPFYPNNTA